ncbi:MAG: type II toxin-antitoxin system VapC family toxin [Cytophagales bacterium]|nr:MAG: type II toxin-antitoxin system VapC family toxin [Cytophagales bacterium]
MGERYLLDTSCISKALSNAFPTNGLAFMQTVFDSEINYSVIVRIELLSFKPDTTSQKEGIAAIIASGYEFPLTEAVIDRTIKIRRGIKIRLPDAIIAATALVYNLTLLADNDADFKRVSGLKYINPAVL